MVGVADADDLGLDAADLEAAPLIAPDGRDVPRGEGEAEDADVGGGVTEVIDGTGESSRNTPAIPASSPAASATTTRDAVPSSEERMRPSHAESGSPTCSE